MACEHSGTHSGATRYSRQTAQLRLVLVCDQCGAERGLLGKLDYSPHPDCSAAPETIVPAGQGQSSATGTAAA